MPSTRFLLSVAAITIPPILSIYSFQMMFLWESRHIYFLYAMLTSILGWVAEAIIFYFLSDKIIPIFETAEERKKRLEEERLARIEFERSRRLEEKMWIIGMKVGFKVLTGTGSLFAFYNIMNCLVQDKPLNPLNAVSVAVGMEELDGTAEITEITEQSSTLINHGANNIDIHIASTITDESEINFDNSNLNSDMSRNEIYSVKTDVHSVQPLDSNVSENIQPSDLTITDKDGHTLLNFNSEQGVLCDGTGKEIAYLQDNRLVTVEGKTIATYNRDMSTFYDENMQPLDVKMDGGTFQHVKDAKGNGVEILNNEISDAKTHKKIGYLEA